MLVNEEQFIKQSEIPDKDFINVAEDLLDLIDDRLKYTPLFVSKTADYVEVGLPHQQKHLLKKQRYLSTSLDDIVDFIKTNDIQFISSVYHRHFFDHLAYTTVHDYSLTYFQ